MTLPPDLPRELDGWLDYIDRTHPAAMELTLDRVRSVAERLGLTQPLARSVLVAGTNGKGSTAVALETLLLGVPGLRVGTTLSPHVHRFNERIRVQGEALADAPICSAFERIEAARGTVPLTYFEFATLAALHSFASADCDVIILEIGLGGRLDAFNIIDADCAIITSIGLDHQAYLGDTVEAIGAEKAGILRAGQAAFFGRALPSSVHAAAAALGLRPDAVGETLDAEVAAEQRSIRLRVQGPGVPPRVTDWLADRGFVPDNCALALAAGLWLIKTLGRAQPSAADLASWASRLALPGRCQVLQRRQRNWLLDVGHNPLAAAYLERRLSELTGLEQLPVAVFGCNADKPGGEIQALLADRVAHWVLVPTKGPRGQSARALAADCVGRNLHQARDVAQGLRVAQTLAGSGGWVLVLGGFFVVGEALAALQGPPGPSTARPEG